MAPLDASYSRRFYPIQFAFVPIQAIISIDAILKVFEIGLNPPTRLSNNE